jgi:hypothetical protein
MRSIAGNEIVHHLIEDPQVVKAMAGDGMDAVVKRIEQLALDCAGLAAQLHIVAAAKLEARLGKSQAELVEIVKAVDPETIKDPRERRQLESIRALSGVDLTVPWQAGKDEADSPPPASAEEA